MHAVLAKVWKLQFPPQQPSVGVRVGAHPPPALGGERSQLGYKAATRIEQFLGPVAAHPVFQKLQMLRVVTHIGTRYLVRSPEALDFVPPDFLGSRPALG